MTGNVVMNTFQAGRCVGEGTAGPISDTLGHSQCGQPALCSPLHYRWYIPLQTKLQTQLQSQRCEKWEGEKNNIIHTETFNFKGPIISKLFPWNEIDEIAIS